MWPLRHPPLHAPPPAVERGIPWRSLRRAAFLACMAVGALLMWLSPETLSGALVMGVGIVIEAFGIIGCDRCG